MRTSIIIGAICIVFSLGASAAQAGPLLQYVNEAYCSSTANARKAGCQKYWGFRINENGQTKSDSLSNCNSGCASDYKEPVDAHSCKSGCSNANFMDK
jgi:hypothetical protein